jgi:nicotinate-nucleotide adenylyltransferase
MSPGRKTPVRAERSRKAVRAERSATGGGARSRDAKGRGVEGRTRTVALLGGSFNPPHVAHVMAAWWVKATQGVDEVWLLPAWRHPFGKDLAPFPDRVRMCRLAVAGLRGVKVSTAERELEGDPLCGKTVRTLEHLRATRPGLRFALVVGTDILREVTKWYRWDRVQELARVIVVGREGWPEGAPDAAPLLPRVSSTDVRARLARGDEVAGLVPGAVAEYALRRGLYR